MEDIPTHLGGAYSAHLYILEKVYDYIRTLDAKVLIERRAKTS